MGLLIEADIRGETYKQIVNLRRILHPQNVFIFGKHYFEIPDQTRLLSSEDLIITEKADGIPVVRSIDGMDFFFENVEFQHSIHYDKVPRSAKGAEDWLILFDVTINGEFLPQPTVKKIADEYGFPTLQVLHKGPIALGDLWKLSHFRSSFSRTDQAEGVVLKSISNKLWGKLVVDEIQSQEGDKWKFKPLISNSHIDR